MDGIKVVGCVWEKKVLEWRKVKTGQKLAHNIHTRSLLNIDVTIDPHSLNIETKYLKRCHFVHNLATLSLILNISTMLWTCYIQTNNGCSKSLEVWHVYIYINSMMFPFDGVFVVNRCLVKTK